MTTSPSASALATSAQVLNPWTSAGWAQRSPSAPNAGAAVNAAIAVNAHNAFMMFAPTTNRLRHCERSEAISCRAYAYQRDCFVAALLAMTLNAVSGQVESFSSIALAGLDPAIHVLPSCRLPTKTWTRGSSPREEKSKG